MLDSNEIMRLLPHRYPMLLVDRVEEIQPGEFARGYKNVSSNEPFFVGHLPDNPVMPGVLIIEALQQLTNLMIITQAGYENKVVYYGGILKAKFLRKVFPGERLMLEVKTRNQDDNMFLCRVCAMVGEEKVFTADITMVVEDK